MDKIRCSVAMATYNGEKYIKEQIDSILLNLKDNDELVISDDSSSDRTVEIIKEYQNKDKRIILVDGPKMGVKKNFENAIKNTNGKYIFLSDQDDIWMKDKIETVFKKFNEEKCKIIVHNADIVDSNLKTIGTSFFDFRKSGSGRLKNIFKNTYIGCCMAFDSSLKEKILPIPNNIEMHDQWIGVVGEKYGKSIFINDCLIKYRRHENNVSGMSHHSFKKMLKNRIVFIKEYIRK